MLKSVKSEMFREKYAHVFDGDDRWRSLPVPTGERFAWSRGDVIAVPGWRPVEHVVAKDATLFEICDEPVHAKLGFLRTRVD